MQLRGWLDRGEAQLGAGPHPDRARRDAETLLLHVLGKNRAWLLAHLDDQFAGCGAIGYAGMLDRRAKGEPIQYITGQAEFYGLPFHVTREVLIPRPETEHLIEKIIEFAPLFPRPRIADVGTGSGAIAIALAHEWSQAMITAIDISDPALQVAEQNAKRIGVVDRIRFLQGDLLAPVSDERFELVVSNPPYVPDTDRALIAVEVREHEPPVALYGGEDGLEIYRRLFPAAYGVLVPAGYIAVEIGFSQRADVESLLKHCGFQNVEFTHDLQGIPRVASARRP